MDKYFIINSLKWVFGFCPDRAWALAWIVTQGVALG
mgnify:CR=1 FL=1